MIEERHVDRAEPFHVRLGHVRLPCGFQREAYGLEVSVVKLGRAWACSPKSGKPPGLLPGGVPPRSLPLLRPRLVAVTHETPRSDHLAAPAPREKSEVRAITARRRAGRRRSSPPSRGVLALQETMLATAESPPSGGPPQACSLLEALVPVTHCFLRDL